MEDYENPNTESGTFSCTSCGAELKYAPGTKSLKCDYCGNENEIPQPETEIEELTFEEHLKQQGSLSEMDMHVVKCEKCGASSTLDPKLRSASCPYCATPLIISSAHDETMIRPGSLLPFRIGIKEAYAEFKKWAGKLWFAPNNLKKSSLGTDMFKGIYLPYWTFDADTSSSYTGQRGDYYYVTESYQTTVNGKSVTKTRRVRKTKWSFASGRVKRLFDDVLAAASRSLPEKYLYALEPWDLENLVPFDEKYLSGFITERYRIELSEGFDIVKNIMDGVIRQDIRRDIGGDEQRIMTVNTSHKDITFKHILLPVYISAFKFRDKLYRFMVNARTGEVQGERPYSAVKITLAVIAALAIIAAVVYLVNKQG